MDRSFERGVHSLGLDANFTHFGDPLFANLSVLRFDPWGALALSKRRSLYVTLPLTLAIQDGTREFAFGNLEMGATFERKAQSGLGLSFRLGATLPTAPSPSADAATNAFGALARVSELALSLPLTTTGRAALSAIAFNDAITVRGDFGVDMPLSTLGSEDVPRRAIFRANLAVSLHAGGSKIAYAFESINTLAPSDIVTPLGVPADSGVFHQLGVSAQRRGAGSRAGFGLFIDPSNAFQADDGFTISVIASIASNEAP